MVFVPSAITLTQAQGTPLVPKAAQSMSGMKMSGMNMAAPSASTSGLTTTRDSVTVLLEGKTLPGKGFIHLYDSTPYMILNGHVALHIPCNTNSEPDVDVSDQLRTLQKYNQISYKGDYPIQGRCVYIMQT